MPHARMRTVKAVKVLIHTIPIKMPAGFPAEIEKPILKFRWNCKGPGNRQNNLEKEEQNQRTCTFQSPNLPGTYKNRDYGVAVQGWAQLEGTELRAETYTPPFTVMFDLGAAAIQCRKGFPFNKRHQGNRRAERK